MPLYMDLHIIEPNITQEELNVAHIKDLEIQEKHGLEHKKYFVNFEEKTVFCLIKAPHKKALHDSHAEVHGLGPCNVVEVSALTPTYNFYSMIGDCGGKNEYDVALTSTGEIDTGYRTLLLMNLINLDRELGETKQLILKFIEKYDGCIIEQPDDRIMASFLHSQDAFLCNISIVKYLKNRNDKIEFIIGMVTGKPVDEVGDHIFEATIQKLNTLCMLGSVNFIYVDEYSKMLYEKGGEGVLELEQENTQFVSPKQFQFFEKMGEILEKNQTNPHFTSEQLAMELGLSRAQAYRKIKEATNMSPNILIRETRLRKSLHELKDQSRMVAEVAYNLGFNSPTYFTRLFRQRFGVLPSTLAKG